MWKKEKEISGVIEKGGDIGWGSTEETGPHTVILQPLSDVHDSNVAAREVTHIQDELVSTETVNVLEHDGVIWLQLLCHVVGVQDSNLTGEKLAISDL